MITRILLAMYLAIWSPALCCCGAKAALGAVTGIEVAACGQVLATKNQIATGGCCAHRDSFEPEPSACQATNPTSPSSDDDQSPCRCHETVESKVRIDTGAKISLPAPVQVDTLTVMLSTLFTHTLCGSAGARSADADHRSPAPPAPLTTLLAQHCLLLT